ncbi:MAG: ribose-5-phosphate isomerase RpiA [Thermomicrobiales bacterium]|nr:ribose-5-phosphate isomerase RpiA [Thermomicrobiales bacterium]
MDRSTRLSELARVAAAEVRDGMLLGLGTGTTAAAVVREIGVRVAAGLRVSGVATSARTAALARELGIPLLSFNQVERLDLGIDGADEIDPELNVIKGGGGALLHEKLVALACDDYLIVASSEKLSPVLGTRFSLPAEVVSFGWPHTERRLRDLGLEATLRRDENGRPARTDGGHFILDCARQPIPNPAALGVAIKEVIGVVDHGLFVGIARRALIAEPDGAVRLMSRPNMATPQL